MLAVQIRRKSTGRDHQTKVTDKDLFKCETSTHIFCMRNVCLLYQCCKAHRFWYVSQKTLAVFSLQQASGYILFPQQSRHFYDLLTPFQIRPLWLYGYDNIVWTWLENKDFQFTFSSCRYKIQRAMDTNNPFRSQL